MSDGVNDGNGENRNRMDLIAGASGGGGGGRYRYGQRGGMADDPHPPAIIQQLVANQLQQQANDMQQLAGNRAPDYQIDNAAVDLEHIAKTYSGYALMQRLYFVAEHCPPLAKDALSLLLTHLQTKTHDVQFYQRAHQLLVDRGISIPPPVTRNGPSSHNGAPPDLIHRGGVANEMPSSLAYDVNWVDKTTKAAQLKLEKLDQDLKHSKGNSIKESIRRGHDDLGDHYLDMGNLAEALKCFSRARDYSTSNRHTINMCFNVIKVSLYMHNWPLALNYVIRAENAQDGPTVGAPILPQAPAPPSSTAGSSTTGTTTGGLSKEAYAHRLATISRLKAASGVAELASKKYKAAAKNFLQINFDSFDYPTVLSASDVAVYGCVSALATFDRADLKKSVLGNPGFKQFLEHHPQLNDVIRKFNDSQYESSLRVLDELKDSLLLDPYLAPHVDTLYTMIRHRGIVQYFSPYVSADLGLMAKAFNTSVAELENELIELILDGQIRARIDSHNKLLMAKAVDERVSAYSRSLAVGKALAIRSQAVVLRAAMQRAKIGVRHPPRIGAGGGGVGPSGGGGGGPHMGGDDGSMGGGGAAGGKRPPSSLDVPTVLLPQDQQHMDTPEHSSGHSSPQ